MIHPTSADLLAGVAAALEETVLPDLARGTAARRQLQAALSILRRVAFALPAEAAVMAADVEDTEAALARVASLQSASPLEGEVGALWRRVGGMAPTSHMQGDGVTTPPTRPFGATSPSRGEALERHLALQAAIVDLQSSLVTLPEDLRAQITSLLVGLHRRMADRALALIPPPAERGAKP